MATRRKKPARSGKPRRDPHREITAKIIGMLEQGVRPWDSRWTGGAPLGRPLRHNGAPYQGINTLLLWSAALEQGHESRHWMTYRQAAKLGGQVRKGERGTMVVFGRVVEKTEVDDNGEERERRFSMLRHYSVFNADQIDGLPAKYRAQPRAVTALNPDQPDPRLEKFFEGTGADIRFGGGRAFYRPSEDFIQMPVFQRFSDAGAYYATMAHETVHWTSDEERQGRGIKSFNRRSPEYAREELIAEIGSAFLCADLGLEDEPREDHASYVSAYLSILKEDPRAIVKAARAAESAVDWLHELVPGYRPEYEIDEEPAPAPVPEPDEPDQVVGF